MATFTTPYKNIKNPKIYLDSKDFAHNLITYPNGSPATMDIDAVHMNTHLDIIMMEQKQDFGGYIFISHMQRDVYLRFAQADFVKVYLVGTHDYTSLEPTDMVYFCEIEDLGNPVPFETHMNGLKIRIDHMHSVPKEDFNKTVQSDRVFPVRDLGFKN